MKVVALKIRIPHILLVFGKRVSHSFWTIEDRLKCATSRNQLISPPSSAHQQHPSVKPPLQQQLHISYFWGLVSTQPDDCAYTQSSNDTVSDVRHCTYFSTVDRLLRRRTLSITPSSQLKVNSRPMGVLTVVVRSIIKRALPSPPVN